MISKYQFKSTVIEYWICIKLLKVTWNLQLFNQKFVKPISNLVLFKIYQFFREFVRKGIWEDFAPLFYLKIGIVKSHLHICYLKRFYENLNVWKSCINIPDLLMIKSDSEKKKKFLLNYAIRQIGWSPFRFYARWEDPMILICIWILSF